MFSDTADEDSFTQAKPEKGLLTRVFTKAVEIATIGLVAAVAWQVFLDPIFFPIFHDPTNLVAQSWVAFIRDSFGWIADLVGFTGDGGLMQTDFMEGVLAPYKANLAMPTPMDVGTAMPDGFSISDL